MSSDSNKDYIDGVFNKIHKKIEKRITAKYDKIKDWVMDPKGYFLIDIDRKSNLLRVGYCTITKKGQNSINNLVAEITGTTAIEILNTLESGKINMHFWRIRNSIFRKRSILKVPKWSFWSPQNER